ncbi:hypothetical protein [Chromobacterium sp. LK1]|uniref:hypothetical protein n=1 Tax=Chromobacterium sp. LK1 TaxID=1628193 RepID=UPI000A4145F6|nr:hypothetical protein [Chromobacterium sp. LK1]
MSKIKTNEDSVSEAKRLDPCFLWKNYCHWIETENPVDNFVDKTVQICSQASIQAASTCMPPWIRKQSSY